MGKLLKKQLEKEMETVHIFNYVMFYSVRQGFQRRNTLERK